MGGAEPQLRITKDLGQEAIDNQVRDLRTVFYHIWKDEDLSFKAGDFGLRANEAIGVDCSDHLFDCRIYQQFKHHLVTSCIPLSTQHLRLKIYDFL